MLLLLLLIIKVRLGDFNCDTCITQPLWLWSEKSDCPICSIDGEKYVLENCESDLCDKPYLDYHNPNNWTTCDIQKPICDARYKYRSIDGSCNNLDNPTWGMVNTAFTRILPAQYRDGKHLIRLAQSGEPLPLARKLTTDVFTIGDDSEQVSSMASSWGQVVAHDLVYTKGSDFSDCCQMVNENICLPLEYPTNDYFFSQFNVTCDNFRRSHYAKVGEDCHTGASQQINYNTHTLDGSVIYGSDTLTSNSLRSFSKGILKSRKIQDGREFLPNVRIDESNVCQRSTLKEPCYTAGDSRVNANTGLSAIQVLLQRGHNKIARKLSQLHTSWPDEKVFQESRRIVIAIYQHITYKEWLPLYIGKQIADETGLTPYTADSYINYNKLININLFNSFVAGAFRIGHSGIRSDFKLFNRQHQVSGKVSLNEWMNRPVLIEKGSNYDQFVLGLVNHPMQFIDHIFSTEYSNRFNHGSKPYGSDMVSTDILRGRDHGLAPYTSYLKAFIGVQITSFKDLVNWMSAKHIPNLQRVYKSVDDIDLLVGGTLERHVYGSKLGPTFLAIITEQFYRLKFGDRFFYEVGNQPHSFNKEQLNQIKKMTLSKVICENADDVRKMPKDSFRPASASNVPVPCHKIPGIDLEYF